MTKLRVLVLCLSYFTDNSNEARIHQCCAGTWKIRVPSSSFGYLVPVPGIRNLTRTKPSPRNYTGTGMEGSPYFYYLGN
jgi:hypothetical protein